MRVCSILRKGQAALVILALLVFAFEFCRRSGERGFFSLDQSIEFDGAYRVVCGQIPYRDFLIPTGPMVFWLQAVFFRMAGVNWGSFVLGAAVINVVATVLAMVALRTLFPDRRPLVYVGGLLTATWFYPPYGTPNMEQTAFLFSLIGLAGCLSALCGERLSGPRYSVFLALAGGCAVLSVLSKQNAGVLFAPLYLLLLLAVLGTDRRRLAAAAGWMGLGAAIVGIAFGTWLIWKSDPASFYEHTFEIPRRLGRTRLLSFSMLREVAGGRVFEPVRFTMVACGLFAVLAAFSRSRSRGEHSRPERRADAALVVCVYLPLYQNAFRGCTLNQWQECLPFAGVILASAFGIGLARHTELSIRRELGCWIRPYRDWLAAGLLIVASFVTSIVAATWIPVASAALAVTAACAVGILPPPRPNHESRVSTFLRRFGRPALRVVGLGLAVMLGCHVEYRGLRDSWDRTVHDIFAGSHFRDYSSVPGLDRLKWGTPTSVHGVDTTDEQLVQLVEFLRREGKPFFVFPDMTILYAIVGEISPQPLLWFHRGLTYPLSDNSRLDRRIVDSLEQNAVEIVVLQKEAWFGTASEQIAHFPILDAYVRDGFTLVSDAGSFEVRRKQPRSQRQKALVMPSVLPEVNRYVDRPREATAR
jgi:hypothetical protein